MILKNNSRFLLKETVQKTFIKNQITHVDKILCGNGFTTSFINLEPSDSKVNIIIVPNKSVLLNKLKQYKNWKFGNKRIKFFYKESKETNFEDADVLFFVADSFYLMTEKLKDFSHKIDKVLIDEYHSIELQSNLRKVLIQFSEKVKEICSHSETSIVTVTATPLIYSKVDISIIPSFIPQTIIYVNQDQETSLKRIKIDLKEGRNVVVFTNSAEKIYHLRNYKNEVKANFEVGENLFQSLVELVKVENDVDSNLTIVSSRGFEGFDIEYKNARVYFFEDRSKSHETFLISNLYQAINRTREGAEYIEYCRQDISNKRKLSFKNIDSEVDKFINDRSISIEKKQGNSYLNKPNKYKDFVIFKQDKRGVYSMVRNEVEINLFKEHQIYDRGFENSLIKKFLNDRNISLKFIESSNLRVNSKIKESTKIKNLFLNSDFITKRDLFGRDYILKNVNFSYRRIKASKDIRNLYLSHFKTYLRRKNYNNERELTQRENIALSLLSDSKDFHKLVSEVTKTFRKRSIEKYGERKSRPYIAEFRIKGIHITARMIQMFANDIIKVPEKWVANRDYNLLTEIGIDEIQLIAKVFNVEVTELDVKSCFPRLIYALNGLVLPIDFYGENKKNKIKINISLNDFFYDSNQKSTFKDQVKNARVKFQNLGFNKEVIEYLVSNFFNSKYKGDLFNFLSYREKQLISKLKKESQDFNSEGAIRRHDSLILFNNKTDINHLNDFEFLGVKGWLNRGKKCQVLKLRSNLPPTNPVIVRVENPLLYIDIYKKEREYEEREQRLTESYFIMARMEANKNELMKEVQEIHRQEFIDSMNRQEFIRFRSMRLSS